MIGQSGLIYSVGTFEVEAKAWPADVTTLSLCSNAATPPELSQ